MSQKRTQTEVDALWPNNMTQYTFNGVVTLRGALDTPLATIVKQLQSLYEGHEAMAGSFNVGNLEGQGNDTISYYVTFTRDVCDDYDVVNPYLLKGGDFNTVLSSQLVKEFDASAKSIKSQMKVKIVGTPVFAK